MANLTPWINYGNGDNLVDIRTKLNSFNTEVNAQVDANTADITTLQTGVATNTADITAAEDAILANVIGISNNAVNITILETKVDTNTADIATNAPFTPSYNYATGSNIVVASTTYANILTLTTGSLEAGVYKLSQSMLYSLDSTTNSAFFRFSTNGGATWSEIRREPKDNTDVLPNAYITTIVHAGGVFEIQVEARKESNGDVLTVSAIDAIFERKV